MDTRRQARWILKQTLRTLALLLAGSATAAQPRASSEETIQYFRQNCYSCHTIGGGRLAGPDLKDVTKRQERSWLVRFIQDPKGVIDSGDAYAQKIFREARGIYMQPVPGLQTSRIEKLLDLIETESQSESPLFAGVQIDDRPLTAADTVHGRDLFLGRAPFESGAPPCNSCHTVADLGWLGGGLLGPDLTTVYSRLEGRKALAAWLATPPTEIMKPIYSRHPINKDENLALIAYLKGVAERGTEEADPETMTFLLAGAFSAALLLVLFDFLWRSRYRAVRRPLIDKTTGWTAKQRERAQ